MPCTGQDLGRQLGCRLVVADRTDPEGVGYVQWRTAWYVAGRRVALCAIAVTGRRSVLCLNSSLPP